jgi:hypothetical protein
MAKKKKITKKILLAREKRKAKREFKEKLKHWKNRVLIRDNFTCQKCGRKFLNEKNRMHPHHIISLQAVKRKYLFLLTDIKNGICLCPYDHKWAPDSPHQGSMEFIFWLKNKFPSRYKYLSKVITKSFIKSQ